MDLYEIKNISRENFAKIALMKNFKYNADFLERSKN